MKFITFHKIKAILNHIFKYNHLISNQIKEEALLLTKNPPRAVVSENDSRDIWKNLKERPGVRILDATKRVPGER